MSSLKRKTDSALTDSTKKAKVNSSITSFFGPPKTVSSSTTSKSSTGTAPNAALAGSAGNFDKAKWVSTLTNEQKELLALEIETLHETWLAHLKDEIVRPEFLDLKKFLRKEEMSGQMIFPPSQDVYSWSRHTPLNKVKCVIVGQDPYHNVNQAHGLAFSVRPPTPAPPSLRNMYICLKNDYPDTFQIPPKNSGLLTPWADRGVLLLNTCLTVRAHNANSHANHGWERFTQKVIDTVARVRTRGVVFLAWGAPAGQRVKKIDTSRHLVLKSVHPSPLSAHKGFFNCKHFKQTNEWVKIRYGDDAEIDWDLTGNSSTLSKPAPAAAPIPAVDAAPASAMESKAQPAAVVVEQTVVEKVVEKPEEKENNDNAGDVVAAVIDGETDKE